MLQGNELRSLAEPLSEIAHRAGAAIMAVYESKIAIRYKEDRSPVTDADERAEAIIVAGLAKLYPSIPIVAEELVSRSQAPVYEDEYFLVDPLDGTQAFVKSKPEFTVNIALIQNGAPVFGVVYAPALKDCYVTVDVQHAVRFDMDCAKPFAFDKTAPRLSSQREPHDRPLTALISPSRFTAKDDALLRSIGRVTTVQMYSSLKFCGLARGIADVYPRFGATSTWDTAAGQAVLEAAGGCVLTADGMPLRYGLQKDGFLNPDFIAWRRYPPTPD